MNKKMVIIATIVLIFDQIFKSIAQIYDVNINIISHVFRLNYYQNTGAAWSILEGEQTLLIVVTFIMLVLIFNMMYSYEDNKLNNIAFGLLIGGIIGNLIDRVFYAYVRDFIELIVFGYNFPIFNIADMGIVIGVILIIISTIKGEFKNGVKSRRKLNKNW